jgi:hypothetical protein
MQAVDDLLMADGEAHPGEIAFRDELRLIMEGTHTSGTPPLYEGDRGSWETTSSSTSRSCASHGRPDRTRPNTRIRFASDSDHAHTAPHNLASVFVTRLEGPERRHNFDEVLRNQ